MSLEHIPFYYLLLILGTYIVATASPGPAILAIVGSSMRYGRRCGLALASGVTLGSFTWGIAAALGMGTVMSQFGEAFIYVKILGGLYLLWLASKSLRAFCQKHEAMKVSFKSSSLRSSRMFLRGYSIHLMNPKAMLFWSALITVGLPAQATQAEALLIVLCCSVVGACVFLGYAFLFSSDKMVAFYGSMRRWIEGTMTVFFGIAGAKVIASSADELAALE